MKKIIFILINLLCLLSFFASFAQKATKYFLPDTSVNKIKLNDFASAEKVLGKSMWSNSFEEDGFLPRIEVLNKNKTQGLRLFFHYGGSVNSVDEFEIFKVDSFYEIPEKAIVLDVQTFKSSKNIILGINKERVLQMFGKNYRRQKNGEIEELTYELKGSSLKFLKRYNQAKYQIKCSFKNGALVKYAFGFVYI